MIDSDENAKYTDRAIVLNAKQVKTNDLCLTTSEYFSEA